MGYSYEVAIKCAEGAFEMLREAYRCVNLKPSAVYKDGCQYIIYWKDIRWSRLYEDASYIMDVLDALDDKKYADKLADYGYKVLAIGESYDDVEVRDNDEDIELVLIRKIDISQGLETVSA